MTIMTRDILFRDCVAKNDQTISGFRDDVEKQTSRVLNDTHKLPRSRKPNLAERIVLENMLKEVQALRDIEDVREDALLDKLREIFGQQSQLRPGVCLELARAVRPLNPRIFVENTVQDASDTLNALGALVTSFTEMKFACGLEVIPTASKRVIPAAIKRVISVEEFDFLWYAHVRALITDAANASYKIKSPSSTENSFVKCQLSGLDARVSIIGQKIVDGNRSAKDQIRVEQQPTCAWATAGLSSDDRVLWTGIKKLTKNLEATFGGTIAQTLAIPAPRIVRFQSCWRILDPRFLFPKQLLNKVELLKDNHHSPNWFNEVENDIRHHQQSSLALATCEAMVVYVLEHAEELNNISIEAERVYGLKKARKRPVIMPRETTPKEIASDAIGPSGLKESSHGDSEARGGLGEKTTKV